MQWSIWTSFVGLILTLSVHAQEWKTFTPKEGRCSILFPDTPKKLEAEIIEKKRASIYVWQQGEQYAMFLTISTIIDPPRTDAERQTELDNSCERMAKSLSTPQATGKILAKNTLTLGKYPGREISLSFPSYEGKARLYLANDRMYQLLVLGKKDLVAGADTKKFLESFKITD